MRHCDKHFATKHCATKHCLTCCFQFGKDKKRCVEFLTQETDRMKAGPYGRYNQQRKFSLQGTRHSFAAKSSLTSLSSLATSESTSTFQSYDETELTPRRSLTLPFHLNLPPRKNKVFTKKGSPTKLWPSKSETCEANQPTSDYATSTHSNDSIPMVVLTPDSPVDFFRSDDDGISDVVFFGHAKSVTATCLDIDLSSRDNDDDNDDDDLCSLRTTTVSQGVINFLSGGSPMSSADFTTIQQVRTQLKIAKQIHDRAGT